MGLFSKVYVINLDHRVDRWDTISKHLLDFEITHERLSATRIELDSTIPKTRLGRISCFHSHLRALRKAHSLNLENVLILEDDCVFSRRVDDDVLAFLRNSYWEILFLGCNLKIHNSDGSDGYISRKRKVAPMISEVEECATTHAILYNKTLIKKIVDFFPTDEHFFSQAFGSKQWLFTYDDFISKFTRDRRIIKYAVDPILCNQAESFSDIAQASVDYRDGISSSWNQDSKNTRARFIFRKFKRAILSFRGGRS